MLGKVWRFFPQIFFFIVFLQSSSHTSTVLAGGKELHPSSGCFPCQIVLQQKEEEGWDGFEEGVFSKSMLHGSPGSQGRRQSLSSHHVHLKTTEGQCHSNRGSSSPWSCALCEHAADTREVTERGRWGMCCVTSWGFVEKEAQVLPSPNSMESSFWQMPGLKSSLYVPKGWINRLLRHNYLPTVPKLVTNKAIVHFHLM